MTVEVVRTLYILSPIFLDHTELSMPRRQDPDEVDDEEEFEDSEEEAVSSASHADAQSFDRS